jgi:PEGA domain
MGPLRILTGLLIVIFLSTTPAQADQGRRRSEPDRRREQPSAQSDGPRERAVPRDAARIESEQRRDDVQRQVESQQLSARRYDNRRDDNRHVYIRPYYPPRTVYVRPVVPRVIHPPVVTVVPYRPYVYRPSLSVGVLYGANGIYPYGYTPRAYYDPIPGRPYGGLRITGAPRDAHVFADGYYVGIVNDFDGMFQHLNLEAGPHRIEIETPGYERVAFDVMVQPGRTITFNAQIRY